jgi:transcriptional regulator with XRE-family HTH domain
VLLIGGIFMVLSKKEIGLLIKEARKHKSEIIGNKYTQSMLAEDLELSRGYIGDVENGRIYPSYVLLKKIAEKCEVPFSFFDDGKNSISQEDYSEESKGSTTDKFASKYAEVTDIEHAMEITLAQPGLMLKGELLSDESKIALANAIQMGLAYAEQMQKKHKEKHNK